MNFDLRHLEAFVAAAQHGSFTRAAKSLNVSQPTFTVQIKQLEDALGVRLLDRTTRSVALTQIGRELAPALERLLRDLRALVVNTKALSGETSGHVSIAALPSMCASMIPSIVAGFHVQHTGISIQVWDALDARLAVMVKTGEVDFGLGGIQTNEPDIEFAPLFQDRMHAVFPRGCPLEKKQKAVSLTDLISYPLILMSRDSSARTVVDHGLAAIGHFAAPAYEAVYASTAVGLVKAGLGVAILPASILETKSASDFDSRAVHRPNLAREIGLLRKRSHTLSPAAEALVRAIREHNRDEARRSRS